MAAIEILKRYGLKVAGATALAGAFAVQWMHVGHAGVESALASVPSTERAAAREIHADGRVVAYPGAVVVVGTDVGGTLATLRVLEKTRVKKGDVLAEIDSSEQRAGLAEARARVAEADVDLRFFDTEVERAQRLTASDAIGKAAFDRSEHDRNAARSRLTSAAATVGRLAATLGKTRITSPIDGVVIERFAEQGETVPPEARLVTVADLSRIRVEAEIDEYDIGRVALDELVVIRAEGLAGSWQGRVEEIPDQVVSRRIKPQDPGRPTDTRVLLVKVAPTEPMPVKLGQRVEVEVQTSR